MADYALWNGQAPAHYVGYQIWLSTNYEIQIFNQPSIFMATHLKTKYSNLAK
jgi:hypothetical protein